MVDNSHKKKRSPIDAVVWALIALYITFFSYLVFLKFQSYGYNDWDLASNSQVLWGLIHGSSYSSLLGVNYFGHHTYFILFLLLPIYALFAHPLTLLLLKTLSLGLAVYPIYLIAKEELGEKTGLAIVFIYLFYPALGYLNLYEFQVPVFATLFLSWMLYFFKKGCFGRFVLFMVLSLLCQETISLIIILMGVYAFFAKKNKKWVLTPILLGAAWFLAMVKIVLPYFNKGNLFFLGLYSHMGNSISEIIKFIITSPVETAKLIFAKQKLIFLNQLFMPLSFLCLLDFYILIIFPILLLHLLSVRQYEHTIYFHYAAELLPFLFISTIYGIKRFLKLPYVNYVRQGIFLSLILIVAIASNIILGPQVSLIRSSSHFKKDIWDYQKDKFLDAVPADAGIVATFEFLPKLSQRRNLYSFHNVSMGIDTFSNKPYNLPKTTGYALIDFNDNVTFSAFYVPGLSEANLQNFFFNNNWGVVDMRNNIVLLKRNYRSHYSLYRVIEKLPKIQNVSNAKVNDELEFLGYDIKDKKEVSGGRQIDLILYWKALKKVKHDYANFIDIISKKGNLRYRFAKPICYRIFPTYLWQEGQVIKEEYNLFMPDARDSGSLARIGFFDYKTKEIYQAQSQLPGAVGSNGEINLEGIAAN
ncbi:MAG: DUF2079 domain-containing protein [Candidatus Omnitrophota bacterium]